MFKSKLICGSIDKHSMWTKNNFRVYNRLIRLCKKFHGDPKLRSRVITEKQCYVAMKYIEVHFYTLFPNIYTLHFLEEWKVT